MISLLHHNRVARRLGEDAEQFKLPTGIAIGSLHLENQQLLGLASLLCMQTACLYILRAAVVLVRNVIHKKISLHGDITTEKFHLVCMNHITSRGMRKWPWIPMVALKEGGLEELRYGFIHAVFQNSKSMYSGTQFFVHYISSCYQVQCQQLSEQVPLNVVCTSCMCA